MVIIIKMPTLAWLCKALHFQSGKLVNPACGKRKRDITNPDAIVIIHKMKSAELKMKFNFRFSELDCLNDFMVRRIIFQDLIRWTNKGSINKKPMVSCHGSPVSKGAFSIAMAKNKEPSVINLKLVFVTKFILDRLNYAWRCDNWSIP